MWRLLWRCGGTFGRHGSLGCFRIRHDTCRIAIEVNPLGTRYQATPIYASATVGFQASIGLAFRQPSAYQVISNTHLQRFGSALQKGQRIALQQEQYLSLGVGAHGRAPQLAVFVPTRMDSVSASMGMSAKNILPWMPLSSLPRAGRRVFALSLCPGQWDRVPQSRG